MTPVRAAIVVTCALLGSPLGPLGCGVPLSDKLQALRNDCTADAECGEAGVCLDGTCVSTKSDLGELILQVEVASDAAYAPGTSWIERVDGLVDNPAGVALIYDVEIGPVSRATISLAIDPSDPMGVGDCPRDDANRVPITVELREVAEAPGIPAKVFSKSSGDPPSTGDNDVIIDVQGATFDVSITPVPNPQEQARGSVCTLPLPPLLSPNRSDAMTNGVLNVLYPPSAPLKIIGHVAGLLTPGPDYWTADLVDNASGRPISTNAPLVVDADTMTPDFELYVWADMLATAGVVPVIRMTPPANEPYLPVVLWDFASASNNTLSVQLDMGALQGATAVAADGGVIDVDGLGVAARVVIQSEALFANSFGDNASYRTSLETDADGTWGPTLLLPGEYTAIAFPLSNDELAVTNTLLHVDDVASASGLAINVYPRALLDGVAHTPVGGPAGNIPLLLQPSIGPEASFYRSVIEISEVMPGVSSTLTQGDGSFSLLVDPGELDMSLRPSEDTGLPWLVRSRIRVNASEQPAPAQLGDVSITHPVVLSGQVRGNNFVLGGSLIRAFVMVEITNADSSVSNIALQVAETIADANGMYRLLLPASTSQ